MVTLNKIYTKTGDKGTTSLGNGDRVIKSTLRVNAYGTTDETNSAVGLARLHATGEINKALLRIQNDLFDLGADLCCPNFQEEHAHSNPPPLRVIATQYKRLETEIDAMNANLSPLKSFVLPGGGALSAQLHLCRTISRRAERLCVNLNQDELINPHIITYLNRLSDWFFVASRVANNNGENDVLWEPGANRK